MLAPRSILKVALKKVSQEIPLIREREKLDLHRIKERSGTREPDDRSNDSERPKERALSLFFGLWQVKSHDEDTEERTYQRQTVPTVPIPTYEIEKQRRNRGCDEEDDQ